VVEIEVGGNRLVLLPQRAAFLPCRRLLLVADAHLGKAGSFRRLGVPVPEATNAGTLARLSEAAGATAATGIVFLGDLLHSRRGRSDTTLQAIGRWRRERHPELEMTLVRGNHDAGAGDPPTDWHIRCVDGPWRLDGLALAHHPEALSGHYVLAGHLHPAARVVGRGTDALRLPCFHFGPAVGVLPAFGEFTGGQLVPRASGDRVFVVAGDCVRELPARGAHASHAGPHAGGEIARAGGPDPRPHAGPAPAGPQSAPALHCD
jgi:DNA ligase-associated metallophosphoesterase